MPIDCRSDDLTDIFHTIIIVMILLLAISVYVMHFCDHIQRHFRTLVSISNLISANHNLMENICLEFRFKRKVGRNLSGVHSLRCYLSSMASDFFSCPLLCFNSFAKTNCELVFAVIHSICLCGRTSSASAFASPALRSLPFASIRRAILFWKNFNSTKAIRDKPSLTIKAMLGLDNRALNEWLRKQALFYQTVRPIRVWSAQPVIGGQCRDSPAICRQHWTRLNSPLSSENNFLLYSALQ